LVSISFVKAGQGRVPIADALHSRTPLAASVFTTLSSYLVSPRTSCRIDLTSSLTITALFRQFKNERKMDTKPISG
jgi:hypothetical protein